LRSGRESDKVFGQAKKEIGNELEIKLVMRCKQTSKDFFFQQEGIINAF